MKKLFTIIFLLGGIIKMASAQAPAWKWVENGTGGNWEYGFGVMLNSSGNIFLGGRVGGTMTFGGLNVNGPCPDNPFVGKFDNAGNAIWLQSHQYSCGNDYNEAFYKDNADNVYCGGIVGSGSGMFYDKHDSAGNVKWRNSVSGGINCLGITADNAGYVYMTGNLNGGTSFTIGSVTLSNTSGSSAGFILKLDSNGNALWSKSIMGTGGIQGRDIEVDNLGNLYLSGDYTGTPVFGTITPPASSGPSNFFIAKYDTAGNTQWVSAASSARASDFGGVRSIAFDPCGNVFVCGGIQGTATFNSITLNSVGGYDVFAAKLLSDGRWEWAVSAGSGSDDDGYALALDKNYDPYIAGLFQSTAQFGTQSLTSAGANNLFVAKLSNSTGAFQWAQSGGANGGGTSMAVDSSGFCYVTGSFSNTVSFGTHSVSCSSTQNPYLAKLDTVPANKISVSPASFYCPGSSASLAFSTIGTFNNGNVFAAQLSDSSGSFISANSLGQVTSTSGGTINISIPSNIPSGSNYIIRVVSNSPANSSFDYCFRVTIGGGSITAKVSNDTSICSGSFVQLHASGGSTYSWSPGGTLNDSTSANPFAAPTSPQNYTVVVSSGSCGSDTAHVSVNVNPVANISVSPSNATACSGVQVSLTATGATSYTWTPATGLNCYTCANPVATATVSTTYSVTGNGGLCSNTFLDTVTIANTAIGGIVTAVRDTICQNTPGNLTLAGNSSNTIQWQSSTDDINFVNGGSTTANYKTLPLQQTTWYRAIVGSGNCNAISDTQRLYVPPALMASFSWIKTGNNQYAFDSDSSSGAIRSYHWDFGDGQTSTDSNPVNTYPVDTFPPYYVCLTLYDGSNCSYTFCRYIIPEGIPTISAAGDWIIYPNPFSEQLTISAKQTNNIIQNIEMYDVLGRVVINRDFGNTTNTSLDLDVSSLAKGMYFVMIRTADADYMQKVVKQ